MARSTSELMRYGEERAYRQYEEFSVSGFVKMRTMTRCETLLKSYFKSLEILNFSSSRGE